ncbi:GAP family protein [Actinomadura opuntiae]|uniref:GAP family protein n=1 Tax=Actinomadura sp. OS1-43 TaxID=604315 RepID=UPI00255B07C7|nr:GAP family protein [Actinomadura sp. OS1-43]MDL4815526.1 GAP family protein [Actinomadura sp. OS1-43]
MEQVIGEPRPLAVGVAISPIPIIAVILMLILAAKQFTSRPNPSEQAGMPKWMQAIDTFTPVKAASLGALLSAVNPKNLMMCAAAGIAVAQGELSIGGQAGAVAVFTVIAACTVAVPVAVYIADTERMRRPLNSLRSWLERNSTTVMFILLLVIGVVLLGKGLSGLTTLSMTPVALTPEPDP